MPKRVKLPDGNVGVFPDDMSDAQIESVLQKQFAPGPDFSNVESGHSSRADNSFSNFKLPGKNRLTNALGLQNLEDALVGGKHEWDRLAAGVKTWTGNKLTPEEQQQLAQGEEAVSKRSMAADVGQIVAGAAATGGPLRAAGSFAGGLTKTLAPKLYRAVNAGRWASPATVAEAAGGGALSAAATTTKDEDRLDNAILAGTIGAAAPVVAGAVRPGVQWVIDQTSNKAGPVAARARSMLERTLGKKVLEEADRAVDLHNPSAVGPLSAAATADSPKLAALERGARSRNPEAWTPLDQQFQEDAFRKVSGAMPTAGDSPIFANEADDVMKRAHEKWAQKPLSATATKDTIKTLEGMLESDGLKANPDARNLLLQQIAVLARGGNTANTAYELSRAAGRFPELESARKTLEALVDRSVRGGRNFTKTMEKYKAAMDQKDAAEVQEQVLGRFRSSGNVPGQEVTVGNLNAARKAIDDAADKAGGARLGEDTNTQLDTVTDALRRRELYRTVNGIPLDKMQLDSIMASGRNNPVYTVPALRGWLGGLLKESTKAQIQRADDALVSPEAFEELAKMAKDYRFRGLSENEKLAEAILRAQARAAGTSISE